MAKKSTYHYRWVSRTGAIKLVPGELDKAGLPLQVVAKSKSKADKLAQQKASAKGWLIIGGLTT